MARTLDIIDLFQKRYAMFQSIAWENWADAQGQSRDPYPDGVQPSSDLAADLEAAETTWIQETPPAG